MYTIIQLESQLLNHWMVIYSIMLIIN